MLLEVGDYSCQHKDSFISIASLERIRMRILLVRPNSKIVKIPPPLGLMYLASFIRQKGFSDVKIIDARCLRLNNERLKQEIREFDPQLVGIASLHFESPEAHSIAKISKTLNIKCAVVLGGPYTSSDYFRALEDESVDYAVIGEGEESFSELIRCIKEGRGLDNLSGVAYRNNDRGSEKNRQTFWR